MTAAAAVLAGRRAAAALMVDACTINAPDVPGALNETTGQYTPVAGAEKYTGQCRVKPNATQDHEANAGERIILQRTFIVSVPMTVSTVWPNDVVRVTACTLDPALVGARLRVVDVAKGSYLTARRLVCEEETT